MNSIEKQNTVFKKQLGKIDKNSLTDKENFDFVVLGDIQFRESFIYEPEFFSMIEDWNILKPDMIFIVGDLILGGAAECVEDQWNICEKTIDRVEPPFIPLPGGHDIADEESEKIYERRIGPAKYSLEYGNSRFIALNTEEIGQFPGELSKSQMLWLKETLAKNRSDNIFIMMHQPVFNKELYGNKWDKIAELFKGYPVRTVFAGHKHYYRDWGIRDGIRYFITGGGGGDRIGVAEEKGAFPHYMLCKVRGSDVNYAGIKPGAFFAADSITQLRVGEMENIREAVVTEPVFVPYGECIDRDVNIRVDNPYDWALELDLKWSKLPGWQITPEIVNISVAPRTKSKTAVHIKTDNSDAVRYPVPWFETVVDKVKNGGPVKVKNNLNLIHEAYAEYAPSGLNFDGTLDDWGKAKPMPLIYACGFDPVKNPEDLQAEIRFMWNEDCLYAAVDVIDNEHNQPYSGDIVWAADNVELLMGKWHWGLTLTSKGEEVFLYEAPEGREIEVVNDIVKLKVTRVTDTHIVYEAAFPASEIVPLELKSGNSFDTAMIMNDLDFTGKRHWLELTPGWGTFCKGPRVKVILKS
ncbi:MAG TPA: metallophosphoesterase [Victivallales bacterium]|nr:metallophosphoesterase [Victivallales bacterium]